jgi:hypothetical protein
MMEEEPMSNAESFREFVRQRAHQKQLVERFDRHFEVYCREHPDADAHEVRAHAELLIAAMPGLQQALVVSYLQREVIAAVVSDRGDGLPVSGPSAELDADGARIWKLPELWTLDDYRVTLAWFREPGAPAAQLATLIASGEARWPSVDVSRGPWPDTSDLPSWADLAPMLAEDDEDLDRLD